MSKLYTIFTTIFFIIAASIPSYASDHLCDDNKQICYEDRETKSYDISPFKEGGFRYFPAYLADFPRVGIRLLKKNGYFGYLLEKLDQQDNYLCCTLEKHYINTIMVDRMRDHLNAKIPKKHRYPTYITNDDLYFAIWNDKKVKPNWVRAMKYLYHYLLSENVEFKSGEKRNLFHIPNKNLIGFLKESYNKLSFKSKSSDGMDIKSGDYRTRNVYIHQSPTFRDNVIYTKQTGEAKEPKFLQILKIRNVSDYDISVLIKFIYDPHNDSMILKSTLQDYTDEEQEIIGKYITFPPEASEIEKLMKNFVEEMKRRGKLVEEGKIHPIDFATWVHMEIIRIHPFIDNNGKTARLWMNAFLLRYGYLAPILTNEEGYIKAVITELRTGDGSFTNYIVDAMKWTAKYFTLPNGNPELDLSLDML